MVIGDVFAYAGSMNTHFLPSPNPGRFLLIVSPASTMDSLFELIARLALQGSLSVLDGGNTFQGYALARMLRRQVVDIEPPLQRVLLSRAFTCYQMSALLSLPALTGESQPADLSPIFVLDFLASFYDQGVRIGDRRRLLGSSVRQLQALSRRRRVVVWIRQRTSIPEEALNFLEVVQAAAGQVWTPPRAPALPVERQMPLFSL
jgi:hypothetical protein